jgi:hypothetical protein
VNDAGTTILVHASRVTAFEFAFTGALLIAVAIWFLWPDLPLLGAAHAGDEVRVEVSRALGASIPVGYGTCDMLTQTKRLAGERRHKRWKRGASR